MNSTAGSVSKIIKKWAFLDLMINMRQFCEQLVRVFESGSSRFEVIGDKTS